ncbi:hypothetical protein ROU88_00905 [Macrococcus capreoli]
MVIDFQIREKLNIFLVEMSKLPISKFSPSVFSKYANVSIDDSFNLLLEYVKTKELILTWELRCPNCNRVLDISKSINDEQCLYCEEELDITQNDLFPVFNISEDYKEFLKRKKFERVITLPTNNNEIIPLSALTIYEENIELVKGSIPSVITPFINIDEVKVVNNNFNATNQQNNIGDNNTNIMNNSNDVNINEIKDLLGDLKKDLIESNQETIIPLIEQVEAEVNKENFSGAKSLLTGVEKIIGSSEALASLLSIFGIIPS